jgi:hypothetical protein
MDNNLISSDEEDDMDLLLQDTIDDDPNGKWRVSLLDLVTKFKTARKSLFWWEFTIHCDNL